MFLLPAVVTRADISAALFPWLPILISVIALVVSVASFRQRARLNPQPRLVPEWLPGNLRPTNPVEAPFASLWVVNHGDAPARDVRVWISTRPGESGDPALSVDLVEPTHPIGRVEAPFTRQATEDFDEYLASVWKLTVPAEQVVLERPVITIRWRQAPFRKGPRTMRVAVSKGAFASVTGRARRRTAFLAIVRAGLRRRAEPQ